MNALSLVEQLCYMKPDFSTEMQSNITESTKKKDFFCNNSTDILEGLATGAYSKIFSQYFSNA